MIPIDTNLERLAVMTAEAWLDSVPALEFTVDKLERLRLCNAIAMALRAADMAARCDATTAALELVRHVSEEVVS